MTAEEFTHATDMAMTPAIDSLVTFAFRTVPPENVELLVAWYMDLAKQVAVGAVRSIIAERRH